MTDERIYYSHDAEIHAMRIKALITVVSLTSGLVIGAGLALLFAPATGKTTRHNISKNVEEGVQTGRDTIEPMIKQAKKDLNELREKID
jgi:gas vesicle protein